MKSLSKELRLSDIVEFIPPKRYSECMDLISSCDVSLIIETTCEEGIYLPTKCVDAFQCSKPIFCVSPKIGTLRDIVEKFHVGYISDIDNIDDVVSQIKRMLMIIYSTNCLLQIKDSSSIFEEYIAEQFAELLK